MDESPLLPLPSFPPTEKLNESPAVNRGRHVFVAISSSRSESESAVETGCRVLQGLQSINSPRYCKQKYERTYLLAPLYHYHYILTKERAVPRRPELTSLSMTWMGKRTSTTAQRRRQRSTTAVAPKVRKCGIIRTSGGGGTD